MEVLGIDIGGSGIKAAIVNTQTGELMTERHRIETPRPATPENIGNTIVEMVNFFEWKGMIGCGFPGLIRHGVVQTAANLHTDWQGVNIDKFLSEKTHLPTFVINDADAAGVGEIRFGGGKGKNGVLMLITLGTGIGTALFVNGHLVPNTELGHLEFKGGDAELYASDAARVREDLSWKDWAKRVNEYLIHVESLFSPDLVVIGGGASKKEDKIFQHFTLKTPVVAATLKNQAGIIGAAYYAAHAERDA